MHQPERLVHDFFNLQKHIASFSDKQAKVVHFTDDISEFAVEITPHEGLYHGGKFLFKISPQNYPTEAPGVLCETMIWHPNIDSAEDGSICLNLLDEWAPKNDLEDCVQGVLFLLHNPNLEDPLSPWFAPEQDYEQFAENVSKSLQGENVEGVQFEKNVVGGVQEVSTTAPPMPELEVNDADHCRHTRENHDAHSQKLAEKILDIQIVGVPLIFLETPDGQCMPMELWPMNNNVIFMSDEFLVYFCLISFKDHPVTMPTEFEYF